MAAFICSLCSGSFRTRTCDKCRELQLSRTSKIVEKLNSKLTSGPTWLCTMKKKTKKLAAQKNNENWGCLPLVSLHSRFNMPSEMSTGLVLLKAKHAKVDTQFINNFQTSFLDNAQKLRPTDEVLPEVYFQKDRECRSKF